MLAFERMHANLAKLPPITDGYHALRATELIASRTLSHGLQMGDALTAANVEHFGAVQELAVEAFVP